MAKVSLGATQARAVAPPKPRQRKRPEEGNNQRVMIAGESGNHGAKGV
jgi:hypothetical protein